MNHAGVECQLSGTVFIKKEMVFKKEISDLCFPAPLYIVHLSF